VCVTTQAGIYFLYLKKCEAPKRHVAVGYGAAAPPVEDLGIDELDCEIVVVDARDLVVAALELQERLTFVALDLQAGVAAVRALVFPSRAPVLM